MTRLRIATRGSALARWQADHVADLLRAAAPGLAVEAVVVETRGDRRLDAPIWDLGGKGVFAKEVQAAVLDGRADVAVHSAKDLPSTTPDGLVIGAVPARGDVRDALVGSTLAALPRAAVVATGSLRRRAQLAHLRPDLRFEGLRGNMARRVGQAGRDGVTAVVAAAAALVRLGWSDRIADLLDPAVVVPQVGQGALAVECRAGDDTVRGLLLLIEDPAARCKLEAERGFLAELGGDCSLPAGAVASQRGVVVSIEGIVAAPDGSTVVRAGLSGPSGAPAALGRALARRLLDDGGGAKLLGRA